MGIKAIAVELSSGNTRGKVTIESDLEDFAAQINELTSAEARHEVLRAAVEKGATGSLGISRLVDPPHPVNSEKESIMEMDASVPMQSPLRRIASYRATYEVTGRP